jgi:hypothetical protein
MEFFMFWRRKLVITVWWCHFFLLLLLKFLIQFAWSGVSVCAVRFGYLEE